MCGIAGWVDDSFSSQEVLDHMTQALTHRGPDARGFYTQGPLSLGHSRLSIIDLTKSCQPMVREGRYALSYNGELYNFRELREELETLGVHFHTQGDTEVVLHALIAWGEKALHKFSGMFALSFWDQETETLLLARDPLGVKPLYWFLGDEKIIFASELKAMLQHPHCSSTINPNAIGLYLEGQYIPAPQTMFQNIYKLEPAHFLSYRKGVLRKECYWTPSYLPKWEGTEEEMLFNLEKVLRSSVRSMLIADVPLGAFVSGGLDSSLIASLMQQESGKKAHLFSIALNHSEGEQAYAKQVAQFLGAHFYPLTVEPSDLISALSFPFDEPLGDQAILPTLLLSEKTRKHVKVVLTGEGADEIFAGYSNYPKKLKNEPLRRFLHASFLPYLYPYFPMKLRKSRLCKLMARTPDRRHATIASVFDREGYSSLLTRSFLKAQDESLEDIASRYYEECDGDHFLDQMLHTDTRLWLSDDLLTKVDRATMAHSLEARVPYLDHRVVEFAARLPCSYKLRGSDGKWILKKLAEKGFLPKEIIHRPKKGFVVPLGDWFEGPLKPLKQDVLATLLKRGIFREKTILHLEKRAKKSDATRFFSLIALELWFRNYAPHFRF